MIEIRVGEFIQNHLKNIVEYCKKNLQELENLKDLEYSKENFKISYSFISEKKDNYWKEQYLINGKNYRFCSEFGGSAIKDGETKSEMHGRLFIKYLKDRDLLLEEYKNKEMKFIVGNSNNNSENQERKVLNYIKIKNIILYGAPGVGKTHNYQNLISMIEEGKDEKEIFEAITDNKTNEKVEQDKETFKIIKDEKRVEFVTFHQSYSYEDFIEGFRPNEDGKIKLEDGIFKSIVEKAKTEQKNFYIVIDEINRGNISKIFGELITLIEEDKRDKYDITLPYSKKSFKVPSNLYIIATMNSTDKSIATIDIALRRRFTFLKMKPNLNLVENADAKELMQKLNDYIKDNLNEDYMLGHSYFMNVKNTEDLEFVKEYKIKPLLEEYFYADDNKLPEVKKILSGEN